MKFLSMLVVLMVALLFTAVEAKSVQKTELLGFSQFVGQSAHAKHNKQRRCEDGYKMEHLYFGRCIPA